MDAALSRTSSVVPLRSQPVLQRAHGRAEIAFKRRGGATVLADLYQEGCCKLRLPAREAGRPAEAVLINTAGGLTDGDRLEMRAGWGEGACALVTSQAAERIYRSRGAPAEIATRLDVAPGAWAGWLPQETILFDGGRLARRTEAHVAPGATLLACESLVAGRRAMGEVVRTGAVHDAWRIYVGGRLVFADGFQIDGRIDEVLARPAVARGATALATVLYVGADAADRLTRARVAQERGPAHAGASVIGPVLVARLLAPTGAELRAGLMVLLEALMPHPLPRLWRC